MRVPALLLAMSLVLPAACTKTKSGPVDFTTAASACADFHALVCEARPACGTALSVCGNPRLNHVPSIEFGLLGEESTRMLSEFFRILRNK